MNSRPRTFRAVLASWERGKINIPADAERDTCSQCHRLWVGALELVTIIVHVHHHRAAALVLCVRVVSLSFRGGVYVGGWALSSKH